MPACGYPAYVYVVKVSWGSRGVYLDFFDIQGIPLPGDLRTSFFSDTRLQSCSLVAPSCCLISALISCSHFYPVTFTLLSLVIFYPYIIINLYM